MTSAKKYLMTLFGVPTQVSTQCIMTKKMGLHTKQEEDKELLEGMMRALADATHRLHTYFLENCLGLMEISQISWMLVPIENL